MRMVLMAFFIAGWGACAGEAQLGSPEFQPTPEHPLGWRGDGSGRYPAATPPSEWFRRPKGVFNSIRVQAARPKGNAPEGQPLNMGAIRDWLIAGPFDAREHSTALDDVSQPNETALQPAVGDEIGGKKWSTYTISVSNQSQSWQRLVLDFALIHGKDSQQERQNHPGTLEPAVAYAFTYLYAPETTKVLLRMGGTNVHTWLNGNPVKTPKQYDPTPMVELNQGWNRLLVKAASSKANWNLSALLTPAPGSGYETKNIQWMAPMPGASWSSPVVVGSKIFINADDCSLLCLNKDDGRVLWARSVTYYHALSEEDRKKFPDIGPKVQKLDELMNTLPADLNAGLSIDGSKADNNAALHAKIKQKVELERNIRESMGKTDKTFNAWGNDRGWTTTTPVTDGKFVFVAFHGGNKGIGANTVSCFDLDGKNIWNHFTAQTGIGEHGTHATPVLSGNYLLYQSGGTLFCYEKTTGKVMWKKKTKFGGVAGASAMALKAGATDAVLFAPVGLFRVADGVELWKTDLPHSIVTPTLIDSVIYGVSEGNNNTSVYSITFPAPTGDTLKPSVVFKKSWKEINPSMPGTFTNQIIGPPLIHEGLMYVVSEGGALTVLDAKTGAQIYSKPLDSLNPRLTWVFTVGLCTGPTLAGKYIHIRDDQSQTLVIAPGRDYKELAKNVLWELASGGNQQEAQSTPVYEGGRIYYRTQGYLYCIGEK